MMYSQLICDSVAVRAVDIHSDLGTSGHVVNTHVETAFESLGANAIH